MAALTLDQALAQADRLPALPQIVIRILDDLADENANVETLSEHIVSDPAVVARLLAAANSASVAHGKHIGSVRQAMLLLGVARVRSIVTATAVIDRYSHLAGFDSQRLWRHSLGVAVCARQIAEHAGLNPDVAYVAGLLHDIGQLLLYAIDPRAYGSVLDLCLNHDFAVSAAEREVFGIEHAAVGAELARRWRLPADIGDAIVGHHASDDDPPASEMGDAVHIAEVLSHALELGIDRCADKLFAVPPLSELACARMGITWDEFAHRFPQIEARYDCARLTLGF